MLGSKGRVISRACFFGRVDAVDERNAEGAVLERGEQREGAPAVLRTPATH